MRVLVLGASGNTGKWVIKHLLDHQIKTKILIRKSATLSKEIMESPFLDVVSDNISELNDKQMDQLIESMDVVISCLGHTMSFKGMFGKPRNLVVKAIKSISDAAKRSHQKKLKIILMSTTAYTSYALGEKNSLIEKMVLSLFKLLLPPHLDNMKAANYLVNTLNKDDKIIQWILVRPDTLVDHDKVTPYEIKEFTHRSPVFNAGKTSRINVSHFMLNLVIDESLWKKWEFKTPVIYNL
jgi:putative NADH-flavin reductase